MYFYINLLLLFCLLFYLIFSFKRSRIIKKIRCMTECEKQELLNSIIAPAGFHYNPKEDVISSTLDAWQREFGYTSLYDEAAPLAQIVFDCLPIYFDYQDKTWLLELWKGQYGINTGAEFGIYHADTLVSPNHYREARFHAVSDQELLPMDLQLFKNGTPLFQITGLHWWLTGFCMGTFSHPEELTLQASVTFPSQEMTDAFLEAWRMQRFCCTDAYQKQKSAPKSAYRSCPQRLRIQEQTITLFLGNAWDCNQPPVPCRKLPTPCAHHRFRCAFSQWKNRLFTKLYLGVTRPFQSTPDRLLYLWYFLPFALRRMIQPRKRKCYRS